MTSIKPLKSLRFKIIYHSDLEMDSRFWDIPIKKDLSNNDDFDSIVYGISIGLQYTTDDILDVQFIKQID